MPKRQKILVVDDSQLSRDVNIFLLGSIDAEIVSAASGREAIKKTVLEDFDLILMDVVMPDIDGFETVRTIRNDVKNKYTPVIFITALSSDEKRVIQGLSLGAIDFISKPISGEILCLKANNLLELQKSKKELEVIKLTLEQKIEELENLEEEHKKTQDELIKYRDRLEALVEERTSVLEDEITQRKKAEKDLAETLATVKSGGVCRI